MAKGSANPAEAYRKALRAKEVKKNKEARKAVRDTQQVKRDTRELESDIRSLKSQSKLSDEAKSRLKKLESELKYVNEAKEKYVEAHPEARDKVYRINRGGPQRDGANEAEGSGSGGGKGGLYGEDGKLRDPTRSVYFDPVYNPFGVPPPGMPYKERTPEESSDEDDDSDDDDIVMPEGPAPGEGSDSDDSDDIPLPEGPPPGSVARYALPPPLPAGPSFMARPPRPPVAQAPWGWGDEIAYTPQPFAPGPGFGPGPGQGPGPGFAQGPGFRPRPPRPHASMPARPPPTTQDPLSDKPTQTYQERRMQHSLPARPPPTGPSAAITAAATTTAAPKPAPAAEAAPADYSKGAISAAPVMRDLRKEATAFVPRGVKRKQAAAPGGVSVNAAPGAGEVDADGDERKAKRTDEGGLMGRLKGMFGDMPDGGTRVGAGGAGERGGKKGGEGDDEYQKFLEGLGDLA